MAFATGRYMCCERFNRAYEVEHVAGMVRLAYQDRIDFHRGDAEIGPGISLHRIGGHTAGLQAVRVTAMTQDPEVIAEMKKASLDLEPLPASSQYAEVKKTLAAPESVRTRAKAIFGR